MRKWPENVEISPHTSHKLTATGQMYLQTFKKYYKAPHSNWMLNNPKNQYQSTTLVT
jgi:hypothetical protein